MQNNTLTETIQMKISSIFSLKIERSWIYLLGFIAFCKTLTLLFAAQALIVSGAGAGIVALWLLTIWKADKKDLNIRSEFRQINLTDGVF